MTDDECPTLDPVKLDASDSDLDRLIVDATETYTVAAQLGNLSAASQALGVRLRGLSEKAERAAKREKRQELLAGADPCDPQTWPSELAAFINAYHDDILNRMKEVNHEQS